MIRFVATCLEPRIGLPRKDTHLTFSAFPPALPLVALPIPSAASGSGQWNAGPLNGGGGEAPVGQLLPVSYAVLLRNSQVFLFLEPMD